MNLKFKIREIGVEGLRIAHSFSGEEIAHLLGELGVDLREGNSRVDFRVNLHLIDGGSVVGRGTISGSFQMTCSRCLEIAPIHLEKPDLIFTYFPQSDSKGSIDEDS